LLALHKNNIWMASWALSQMPNVNINLSDWAYHSRKVQKL